MRLKICLLTLIVLACGIISSNFAYAAAVVSVQSEKDIIIVRLDESESKVFDAGDKVFLTFVGREERLNGSIQDIVDGKAKISVFEGVGSINNNTQVSLKQKEPTSIEVEQRKRISELDEELLTSKKLMILGGVSLLVGGILYATAGDEKSYDSCPNSASSYQNGSYQSCRDAIDAENKSKNFSKVVNLVAMAAGGVSLLIGFNRYTDSEAKKLRGTSVSFKFDF